MTDRPAGAGPAALRSLARHPAYAAPLIVVLSLILIWALTGGGYFWPEWPWLVLAWAFGLRAALIWARRRPTRGERILAGQAAISFVLAMGWVVIWLLTGAQGFWPGYPIVVLAAALALHWLIQARREESLEARVEELTRTRSGALDAQSAQLRQIERDLHDGAQARLVALSMQLGRAEERLADQPETAA
ncbi:MAG: histidine kinase dimerization/phosphoacceptor domain-containing protein, partial [Solirubrobacteraceae bacterium]